ncbi:MAG: chloride channel protein [Chloroflexi bacterium]|nr:chloride channel protein [Chloroflexota bacterium]
MTLTMMSMLLVGKLLATTFTLGSGNSGGVFAPSLFMGAVLGGLVGTAANMLWPEVAVNPGAYAIVGMAALFAGAARAPITAILIVFEMSGDYKLVLPLMLATVLSTLLADHLFPDSIYTLKLKLKGINWNQGRDQDILQGVAVNEGYVL